MASALWVAEGMLTMLPGSWQCVITNYVRVVFLCRKWRLFIPSRTRRRSSFPCCSSCECNQLLWPQRSCVHIQRGTGWAMFGWGSAWPTERWDLWGLSREWQLCACPRLQFFLGFHRSAAVPGRLSRLGVALMWPSKAMIKLSLYWLDLPLGSPGPGTCTKLWSRKTFPSGEEGQAAGHELSCELFHLFSRPSLLPQLGTGSSCLCVTL